MIALLVVGLAAAGLWQFAIDGPLAGPLLGLAVLVALVDALRGLFVPRRRPRR